MNAQDKLKSRGLKPIAVLAQDRPCGSRLKYMAGCKCDLCRAANTRYETERAKARKAGDWNGIVDAARARRHIKKLRKCGVGRRSIAACSDVPESTIQAIRMGRKTRIRARTERRILAVTRAQLADHACVPAAKTQALIADLVDEGFTKRAIADRLGKKNHQLQFSKVRVTVRNAFEVERVHREMTN